MLVFEALIAMLTAIDCMVDVRKVTVPLSDALVDEVSLTVAQSAQSAWTRELKGRSSAFSFAKLPPQPHNDIKVVDSRGTLLFPRVFVDEPLPAIIALGMGQRTEMLQERMLATPENSFRAQYSLMFVRMGRTIDLEQNPFHK
jgi:hypothetical protein